MTALGNFFAEIDNADAAERLAPQGIQRAEMRKHAPL